MMVMASAIFALIPAAVLGVALLLFEYCAPSSVLLASGDFFYSAGSSELFAQKFRSKRPGRFAVAALLTGLFWLSALSAALLHTGPALLGGSMVLAIAAYGVLLFWHMLRSRVNSPN